LILVYPVVLFKVPVHDARPCPRLEPLPGGDEHADDLAPRARLALEPGAYGAAAQELLRDEDALFVLSDVMYGRYVGVGEAGHGLRLAQHAGAGEGRSAGPHAAQE